MASRLLPRKLRDENPGDKIALYAMTKETRKMTIFCILPCSHGGKILIGSRTTKRFSKTEELTTTGLGT